MNNKFDIGLKTCRGMIKNMVYLNKRESKALRELFDLFLSSDDRWLVSEESRRTYEKINLSLIL